MMKELGSGRVTKAADRRRRGPHRAAIRVLLLGAGLSAGQVADCECNHGPEITYEARFTVGGTRQPGQELTFDASFSDVPLDSRLAYEWDFDGDGQFDAQGKLVRHTFGQTGTYPVTLRIAGPPDMGVWLQDDSGFTSRASFGGRSSGWDALAVADLNGDRHLDLVRVSAQLGEVLLADGDGSFGPPSPFMVIPEHFVSSGAGEKRACIEVRDLNRDNVLDLVVVLNPHGVFRLLGRWDGTFDAPVGVSREGALGGALGQVDGDGLVDLVTNHGREVHVRLGLGGGTFDAPLVHTLDLEREIMACGLAIGDLNGDGSLDAVAGTEDGHLLFLFGQGDGTFVTGGLLRAGEDIRACITHLDDDKEDLCVTHVADMDGDGLLDVVMIDEGAFRVARNLGNDTYQFGQRHICCESVAIGDVNADGLLDVAVAAGFERFVQDPMVTVLESEGDDRFKNLFSGWIHDSARLPRRLWDLNGDDRLDVVVADHGYVPQYEFTQNITIADAACEAHWCGLGSGIKADGMVPQVHVVHADGPELYVGGRFETAGDSPAGHVAKWDGSTWSSLDGGVGGGDPSTTGVHAIGAFGDWVVVGGHFFTAGQVAVNSIAAWDGQAWQALGQGLLRPGVGGEQGGGEFKPGLVHALAVFDDGSGPALYAGGDFTMAVNLDGSQVPADSVAKWDSTGWSALGVGLEGEVRALIEYDGSLFAGGSFFSNQVVPNHPVFRWSGSAWDSAIAGNPPAFGTSVLAFALFQGNLYAAGKFEVIAGQTARNIARYDGNMWRPIVPGTEHRRQVNALAGFDNVLYVGGDFADAGGQPRTAIARYTGQFWETLPGGALDQSQGREAVHALTAYNNKLIVGGRFTQAGNEVVNNIARFDPQATGADPAVASATGESDQVATLAADADLAFARIAAVATVTAEMDGSEPLVSLASAVTNVSVEATAQLWVRQAEAPDVSAEVQQLVVDVGDAHFQFDLQFGSVPVQLDVDLVETRFEATAPLTSPIAGGVNVQFDQVPLRVRGTLHLTDDVLGIDGFVGFDQTMTVDVGASLFREEGMAELRPRTVLLATLTVPPAQLPSGAGLTVTNAQVSFGIDLQNAILVGRLHELFPTPGDFDGDGDADLADYLIFVAAFTEPAEITRDPRTDFDGDGDTDLGDLIAFQSHLTGAR